MLGSSFYADLLAGWGATGLYFLCFSLVHASCSMFLPWQWQKTEEQLV